jgi:N-carbamoylputrescine amidase
MPLGAKVTVCEIHDEADYFAGDWQRLTMHVASERSQLVVLPEMPFAAWLPKRPDFQNGAWNTAVEAHDRWELRLRELAPAIVAATRPVDFGSERYNEGFIWTSADGLRAVHAKSRLQNAKDSWERVWHQSAAAADFEPIQLGELTLGFLIGAELAVSEEAERYRREGVRLVVSPRSTPVGDPEEWLEVACSAARHAGAFLLVSCRAGQGPGWIINPEGELLGSTSKARPFLSMTIQLPMPVCTAVDALG